MLSFGNVLYTWKLNCGRTIWDKIELLLGTSWGTPLELDGNTLGRTNTKLPPWYKVGMSSNHTQLVGF
jgi:hypothetical protein